MDRNNNEITRLEWETLLCDIIRKIEDNGHRRKYLDFLREYKAMDKTKIDEIAMSYGLEYHKESNSYWWV